MTIDKIKKEFDTLNLSGIELFQLPVLGQTVCFARNEQNGKKSMVSEFYSYDEMAAYIQGIKFIQQQTQNNG